MSPHARSLPIDALIAGLARIDPDDFHAIQPIADILPVMFSFIDRDFIFRFVNVPIADWIERPAADIVGRHLRDVIGEAAFAERAPMLRATLAGERIFVADDIHHPTRGVVTVQSDYVPLVGADGAVRGIVALSTDISEQRAAERAIREGEERFRRIADSAPVMMWVTRLDRVREFVNDAYCDFVGLKREDARTLDWRTRIHADDLDRIVAESLAGEATGQPFTLEGRYRRHDGEWRWLRSVSQPRLGADGALSGFIGVAADVTLAKQAELELRREVEERTRDLAMSEARFRSVFDTVLEVLVLMDPQGTIVELNRKPAVWRSPDAPAAIGLKIWDTPTLANYPEHKPLVQRAVKQAAAGEMFNEEVVLDRPGAPTAHLDVSVQPVRDPDGTIIYLLFEARDVTDLKAAQEQLRQSQKMEALGQLTGGIAHDFNNLLTVIVGGLDIIAKRAEEPRLKRYAENALDAAERGARLTAQLLAFSRVQKLEAQPTKVGPLIENMRPLLRNVLGPGIEKRFALDQLESPVMVDPTQLEVAVLNLAINARDAMPEGGVLTICSKPLTVRGSPDLADGDYVELSIADTGAGMSPEVLERAFDPFFTTKEVGKGTGLGLSMVYGMARQSGGTARIDSEIGKGTTVSLLFRAASAPMAAAIENADEPPADSSDPRPLSILVIDDDPDVRGFIMATLEEKGFHMRSADDGAAGLDALERDRPDLIILDFIMPGLSGAEVATQILARHPDQAILFVSGYSETDAIRTVAPGAPLLSKPFRAAALEKAVRGAIAATE